MSPAFNIYKKTNITLVLVKKNSNMELWSLLSLFLRRSWENRLLLTQAGY